MNLELVKVQPEVWKEVSAETIKHSLGYDWPPEKNRVSFALVVQSSDDKTPYCYSTVVEFDSESAYMQHGGNFPSAYGTALTAKGYFKMIEFLRGQYKNLSTRILNKNLPMIKLALSVGFLIVGTQTDKYGDTYLIFEMETKKNEQPSDS